MIERKRTIIDVRTPQEFVSGNVKDSINIPLNEIARRFDKIKLLAQPIILCCASGSRSGQAAVFLKNRGVDCENGGSWLWLDH